jgi:hypothetical protein
VKRNVQVIITVSNIVGLFGLFILKSVLSGFLLYVVKILLKNLMSLGQKLKGYSFVLTEAVNHVCCCCFKIETLILCLEFCSLVMSTYRDSKCK